MKISIKKSDLENLNDTFINECLGFQTEDGTIYMFTSGHEEFFVFDNNKGLPKCYTNPTNRDYTLNAFLYQVKWIFEDCTSTTVSKVFIDFEITFIEK